MAIAFTGSAQNTTQTAATLTWTDPGNTGDYEVMFVMVDFSGGAGWSAPSGWTALFANDQMSAVDGATIGLFYRASAAGGSASISINIPSGAFSHACGVILAFSGADSAVVPVAAHTLFDSVHTDPWGVTCPSVTANAAGGYWIVGAAIDPNGPTGTDSWSSPVSGTWTNKVDVTDASGWNAMSMSAGSLVTGGAASGTTVYTDTRGGSLSAAYAGYSILLTPAATATPTLGPRRTLLEPPPEETPPARRRALVPPAGPGPAVYARRRPLPIEPEEQPPQPARRLNAFPIVQGPAVYARRNAPPEASGEATDVVRKPLAFVPPTPPAVQAYARPRPPALEESPSDPPRRVLYPFSLVQGAAVYARPRVLLEQLPDPDLELRRARPAFVPASVVVQTIFRRPPPPFADPDPEVAIRRALYPFSLVQGAAVYARGARPPAEPDPELYFPPRRALVPPAPPVIQTFAKLPPGKNPPVDDEFFPLPKRLPFSLVQGAAVYARRRPPAAEDAPLEAPAARRALVPPAAAVVPPFARLRRRLDFDDEPLIAPPPRRTIVPPAPAVVPVRFRRLNIVREDEDAVIARPRAPRLYIPFVPTTARPPFVARFIDSNYPMTATDQGPAASLVEVGSYPMEVT